MYCILNFYHSNKKTSRLKGQINQLHLYLDKANGKYFTSIIWKHSSQGGPQHEFGEMIGLIVQCCATSLKSGHYSGTPEKAVRCGVESVWIFSFHPLIQRSLFGNPLGFIVLGNCLEVSFQSNISQSGLCSFTSKTWSENFPFVWDLITEHESFL